MTQEPRVDGGWFGKLSPSGRHVLTTWLGDHDPGLGYRRCASIVDGRVVYVGGYGGGWETDDTVIIYSFTLQCLVRWTIGQGEPTPLTGPTRAGGNTLACANGRHIIGVQTPARSYLMWDDGTVIEDAGSPALSDDAQHLAYLRRGALVLHEEVVHPGPCGQPSFGSNSLMCEVGDGRVLAIADVRNPDLVGAPEFFGFKGIRLMKPHAVWVPGLSTLCYSCHTDDALILVRWRERMGWPLARGVIDQGFHDERPVGNDVRVVWSLGGALQDRPQPLTDAIDVIAAVTPSAPMGDVPWTKSTPIDLTPYIVGDDAHWPRTGDHEMDRRWDGRHLYWIKFGHPDHWEHWELAGDSWYLREDRSQSGAGDYSFHPGRWFPRVWNLGGEVVCNDNRIQEYDPATCALKSSSLGNPRTFTYTLRFLAAWSRITLGGSIGTLTSPDDLPVAVLLEYDPGGPHDTRETGLFVRGWGSSRWQAYDQKTGALLIQTQWMTLGGLRLTPTQGCYRALQGGSMSASLTITTPFPKTAAAGEDVVLEGKSTGGRFDRLFWRYRPHGAAQWTEKEDDFRTTLKFTAGVYDIGLRGEGPDGPAETGVPRLLTVTAAPSAATISSADVQDLQDTLEAEYKVQHAPSETFIDPAGRVLWLSAYLTLRQQGRAHASALAEVVSTIRRIEGRAPQQPGGGGNPGGGGPARVAFPTALWAAYRAARPPTFLTMAPGAAKQDEARKYMRGFGRQARYTLGEQWGVKRAGPPEANRPESKDVLPHVRFGHQQGDEFWGFDVFTGVDDNVTQVNENPGGQLLSGDQVFIPVEPQNVLGAAGEPGGTGGQPGGGGGGDDEQPPTNIPRLTEIAVVDGRWKQQIVGIGNLYGLGPQIDPRPALDEDRSLGFQIVRTFVGDLDQIGLTQDMALDRIATYLQWCAERELLCYPSCGTNRDPGHEWHRRLAATFRSFPHVVKMVEMVNEALQRGGWATPEKLREYAAEYEGLGVPVVLSAPDGDNDLSRAYVYKRIRAFHYRRDRGADDLGLFVSDDAGLNQEPIGVAEIAQPGRRTSDIEFVRALAAGNRRYGFGGFYHAEDALWARPLGPIQRRGAITFLRASYGQ
jgi:hypothetical protein